MSLHFISLQLHVASKFTICNTLYVLGTSFFFSYITHKNNFVQF